MNPDEEPAEAGVCRQCYEEYLRPETGDDGFCSDSCMNEYNRDVAGPFGEVVTRDDDFDDEDDFREYEASVAFDNDMYMDFGGEGGEGS